jgi:hypothetical protein
MITLDSGQSGSCSRPNIRTELAKKRVESNLNGSQIACQERETFPDSDEDSITTGT